MTEQEFLEHHRLKRNPFADEDAQTDSLFKEHCITASYHPAWSKVYGDPAEPATAIVMGSKGSGKTAIRLQIVRSLRDYNRRHPEHRVYHVELDDFNAYLGPLQSHLPRRIRENPDKVLQSIQVWDHLDAMLCETVTELVDRVLEGSKNPSEPGSEDKRIVASDLLRLDRAQRRDLLLLAACYDQARSGSFIDRAHQLRRKLSYSNWATWVPMMIGWVGSIASIALASLLYRGEALKLGMSVLLAAILMLVAWAPYAWRYLSHFRLAHRLIRQIRVGRREWAGLTRVLMSFPAGELASQPIPTDRRSDDRYAMLTKLQSILRGLKFQGLIVLIDRVDEPELVNGRPERMQSLVWPLLDNKLLKHPGLGMKLLLPDDLQPFLDRENREFNERARLDKQNFINNFDWTGEALFDVTVARMKACSTTDPPVLPSQLLEPSVTETRLIHAMQALRTPRNLFRFLYRLIGEHCKAYRSSAPKFQISSETFESTLALFLNELSRAAR